MTNSALSAARGGLVDELASAWALLESREEARALLSDLCTPSEVHAFAERLYVAKLLHQGILSYSDIHEATGVSTTTITRVAKFLRHEQHGGYQTLLARLADE